VVFGAGPIGRQVARQRVAVGRPRLTPFQDDDVRIENLAAQGYWAADLKSATAQATAVLCRRVNPGVQIHAGPAALPPLHGEGSGGG
jgi:hypothetical protein